LSGLIRLDGALWDFSASTLPEQRGMHFSEPAIARPSPGTGPRGGSGVLPPGQYFLVEPERDRECQMRRIDGHERSTEAVAAGKLAARIVL
jgi:hypothetical protein